MSNEWNAAGLAESPEAHYVQSLTVEQLLTMVRNITGKEYNLAYYPAQKKGGLIGSLNRIAIKHLQTLAGKEHTAGEHVGRTTKADSVFEQQQATVAALKKIKGQGVKNV